jgi:hypothetical protein
MSTNNTEGCKFKITTMGRTEVDNRKPCNLKPLTIQMIHDWIDSKPIEERLKVELKKSAATYPNQALWAWQKNYSRHLANIQNRLQKTAAPKKPFVELGDEQPVIRKREAYEENRTVLPTLPENDEFDAGWENPGEDQGRRPEVHPDVQNEGISGSGLDSEHPAERSW